MLSFLQAASASVNSAALSVSHHFRYRPEIPAFPQFISPQVMMNTSTKLYCILTGFSTSCLRRHVGAPMGWYPTIVFLHAIFWVFWCKGKIRKADAPTIQLDVTLSRLIGALNSIIPTILMSDALPATTLPMYSGLHTQQLAYPSSLASLKTRMVVPSGTGLPMLFWKKGR